MENIIPVLIAIVVIIVKAINASNKKAAEANTQPIPKTVSIPNAAPTPSAKKIPAKKKKRVPSPIIMPDEPIENVVSSLSSYNLESEFMDTPSEEETSSLINIDFQDSEDLKKAIIYAEIFNRRY